MGRPYSAWLCCDCKRPAARFCCSPARSNIYDITFQSSWFLLDPPPTCHMQTHGESFPGMTLPTPAPARFVPRAHNKTRCRLVSASLIMHSVPPDKRPIHQARQIRRAAVSPHHLYSLTPHGRFGLCHSHALLFTFFHTVLSASIVNAPFSFLVAAFKGFLLGCALAAIRSFALMCSPSWHRLNAPRLVWNFSISPYNNVRRSPPSLLAGSGRLDEAVKWKRLTENVFKNRGGPVLFKLAALATPQSKRGRPDSFVSSRSLRGRVDRDQQVYRTAGHVS